MLTREHLAHRKTQPRHVIVHEDIAIGKLHNLRSIAREDAAPFGIHVEHKPRACRKIPLIFFARNRTSSDGEQTPIAISGANSGFRSLPFRKRSQTLDADKRCIRNQMRSGRAGSRTEAGLGRHDAPIPCCCGKNAPERDCAMPWTSFGLTSAYGTPSKYSIPG